MAVFGLRLPAGSQGAYVLTVDGRSADSCSATRGTGNLMVNGEPRDDLPVALSALPFKDCGGPLVPVTINRTGNGGGSVSSAPAAVDCGAQCSANIPQGASITFTETADNTSRFLGWSGACTGNGPTCSTTINAASQVTANFAQLTCSATNFCWENPLARGYNVLRIFGLTSRDVWASGDDGSLVHYDGQNWTATPSGTTKPLFAIWGAATNDVWTVGGAVLRWNGTVWNSVTVSVAPATKFLAVWGSSATDVWLVGLSGTIVHCKDTPV